ncbi:hypothetical protein R5P03_08740 [Oenococcus oeni]
MTTNIIQLGDPNGNPAYALTHWQAIDDKPNFLVNSIVTGSLTLADPLSFLTVDYIVASTTLTITIKGQNTSDVDVSDSETVVGNLPDTVPKPVVVKKYPILADDFSIVGYFVIDLAGNISYQLFSALKANTNYESDIEYVYR